MNAGAALYLYGKAATWHEGIALAQNLIDSGSAQLTLDRLITLSQGQEL